eukprot:TRINITY_DN2410_c0_g2_i2.p1 TRINITY_DN2410_c0_g2~~TRINITY_DN2410_c0_g2_i2.p1  ORF type:complete len:206 (+),score=32.20 TRINITY_DN2410_c0_g2_i2:206-823(+)
MEGTQPRAVVLSRLHTLHRSYTSWCGHCHDYSNNLLSSSLASSACGSIHNSKTTATSTPFTTADSGDCTPSATPSATPPPPPPTPSRRRPPPHTAPSIASPAAYVPDDGTCILESDLEPDKQPMSWSSVMDLPHSDNKADNKQLAFTLEEVNDMDGDEVLGHCKALNISTKQSLTRLMQALCEVQVDKSDNAHNTDQVLEKVHDL